MKHFIFFILSQSTLHMSLGWERKPEFLESPPALTERLEPGTFFLWGDGANHCTTTPPKCSCGSREQGWNEPCHKYKHRDGWWLANNETKSSLQVCLHPLNWCGPWCNSSALLLFNDTDIFSSFSRRLWLCVTRVQWKFISVNLITNHWTSQ